MQLILTLAILLAAAPAFAQVDISGTWASRLHEDWQERWPGPDPVNFTGLPINDDARQRGLGYSASLLALPERQCIYYGPTYMVIGPFGLKVWPESEPVTGRVISWNLSGAVDRTPRTIWMDGRPHPPDDAPHLFAGFSTGEWQGNTLVVTTTHIKESPLRRNGVPTSDQTTELEYIVRHGNVLTVTAVITDPVYLSEPYVLSRNWEFDPALEFAVFPAPCTPGIEAPGLTAGSVPHYLPGENPFLTEMSKRYGLPQDAVLGGAETLYPEFRKKLEGQYQRPLACGRYCCGWGGIGTTNGPLIDAANLSCTTREPTRR